MTHSLDPWILYKSRAGKHHPLSFVFIKCSLLDDFDIFGLPTIIKNSFRHRKLLLIRFRSVSFCRRTGRGVLELRKNKNCFWMLLAEDFSPVCSATFLRGREFHTLNEKRPSRKPLLRYSDNDFRFYQIPNYTSRRNMSMIVVRVLRGALKIRYLLLGGAIGGGYSLQHVSWFRLVLGWLSHYLKRPLLVGVHRMA